MTTSSLCRWNARTRCRRRQVRLRSEEHTSELQSLAYLVCRLLLEKKKKKTRRIKPCADYQQLADTKIMRSDVLLRRPTRHTQRRRPLRVADLGPFTRCRLPL